MCVCAYVCVFREPTVQFLSRLKKRESFDHTEETQLEVWNQYSNMRCDEDSILLICLILTIINRVAQVVFGKPFSITVSGITFQLSLTTGSLWLSWAATSLVKSFLILKS